MTTGAPHVDDGDLTFLYYSLSYSYYQPTY